MTTKKYIVIPILFIAFAMLSSCAKKTHWSSYELHGEVKKYTENQYEPVKKLGEWHKGESLGYQSFSKSFSEEGDFERADFFDKNNKLLTYMIPKKENGKIVEEVTYDVAGEFQVKTVYTYLSETKIEFTSYASYKDELVEVAVGTLYLKNGKRIRRDFKTLHDGEVEYEVSMKFLYTKNGMTSGIEKTYPDGNSVTVKLQYLEFDDQNNWTKRLDYSSKEDTIPKKIVIRTYEYY